MRLLHIVPSYLPATRYGGPIYSVHALCSQLVKQGHDVEVYTTNVDGPGVSSVPTGAPVELDGVRVTYFATGLGRRFYRSPDMAVALQNNLSTFDVVHLHSVFLWPTTAGASACRRAGIGYVVSPRGMLVDDLIRRKSAWVKRAWITLFERRNINRAHAVHATSTIEADEIRKLGFYPRSVAVIPNGIDPPPNPPRRVETAAPFVLYLGRINWKKGIDRLIRAMAHVPGIPLVVAGNDEETYAPSLQQLARELGLAERVTFCGPVFGDDKWKLMASATVFVLPSYSENFGNVVLEAMSYSVPVVVTPEVGLAHAVSACGAGIVVNGAPEALGTAIAKLLADRELRKQMGDAGCRAARELFSWDAVARSMADLYLEAA